MRRERQIIAMGGGGFTVTPANPTFDYILAQAKTANPRVCLIATATGDHPGYVAQFYDTFTKLRCRPSVLKFFDRTPDLRTLILSQDVIFGGGGNTKSMLAVWKDWGLDRILREAWRSGIVLSGVSAGAICWFDAGLTDSWAGHLAPLECLGFLKDGCCPHYDGETDRRPSLHALVGRGALPSTLALDDGAAAHFVGRRLSRVVTALPGARAYRVERRRGRIVETPLPSEPLHGTLT